MYNQYGDVLSPEELGELLKIGKSTTYNLLKSGKISSFKIGRNYKIPQSAVEEYISSESHPL